MEAEENVVTAVFRVTTVTIMGSRPRAWSIADTHFLGMTSGANTPVPFRLSVGHGLHRPGTNKVGRDTRIVASLAQHGPHPFTGCAQPL